MSLILTTTGFIGLWLCKAFREHHGLTERQFMDSAEGGFAIYSLSALFAFGLIVQFPISIYLQKKAGVPLPGPTVPNWIAWPVKGLLILLLGFLLFMIIGLTWSSIFQK